MKFLLVNHEYPPVGGGAATATRAIAQNLSSLQHEVTVLTGSYKGLPSASKDEDVAVRRLRCIRKREDRSSVTEMLTFMLVALFRVPFILAKHERDAMIVFFSLPSGPVGVIAKSFFGLPYVVSLRGGDVPGLVPQLNSIHKFLLPIRRLVLKRATAVVANSEGLRELSQNADPVPVRLIPNGVDADFFCPAERTPAERESTLRILFVGRFHEQKNLAFLFEQFAKLPPGAFELHLVGDGALNQHLHTLADRLGISAAITWHGWLPHSAVRAAYQSADCLVNPSLYEGLPNVVLEAMACGLPVIASDVSGNRELVMPGQTGLLFDPRAPAALVSTLMQLRDVDLRVRMGRSARERAVQFFSWKTVASRYAELFAGPGAR